jgi:hypothetical protein
MLDATTEQVSKRIKTELPILFSKADSLHTAMGSTVNNDIAGFLPPTIWSAFAQLTTLLHETDLRIPDVLQLTSKIRNDLYQEFLPVVEQKSSVETTSLKQGIQELKGVLVNSIQQIAERFHQDSIHVANLRSSHL